MWPYEYFNQFSNIEIDNKIGAVKRIFLAIWYGGKSSRENQENKRRAFAEYVNKLEIGGMKFEPVIAEDIKSGDFNSNILTEIIQSTFVVCDVTPVGSIHEENLVYNPNVMVELGLALAWKMPEQVIVLWDEQDNRFQEGKGLASDIHNYHIDRIDSQYEGLGKIIEKRIKIFQYKKDILLKNTKSRIDDESLLFISGLHGLLFTFKEKNKTPSRRAMIRHLLSLWVLRVENLPGKAFCYCLTEMGRLVLRELGVELYPNIIVDTYLLAHWRGDEQEFNRRYKDFQKAYNCNNIEFEAAVKELLEFADDGEIQKVVKSLNPELSADIFYHYLRNNRHRFSFVKTDLIRKISCSNNRFAQFFKE